MVWFHGGGFVSGQASMYGPEHLMDRDIILVTVSYRLGPLGFFSLGKIYKVQFYLVNKALLIDDWPLGTEGVPGNQGMWDQHQSLLWVQQNVSIS